MIITLVGADFSGNKIGTLTTWNISYVEYEGVTYSGDASVTRGSALTATATIEEGYELGSAGVSVTMGGVEVSGAYSQSGNVITISIGAVTGNVVIKVPTVDESGNENTGGNEGDSSGTDGSFGENLFTEVLDSSNGNDWYVMYSKETDGVYGLVSSNSQKAKNVVIENLEAGATYYLSYTNNTANTYRTRIVTFAEAFDDITIAALSADVNTGTRAARMIYYDMNNTLSTYSTTFTNTENAKTLVMTIGWAGSAGGNVDLDVVVQKVDPDAQYTYTIVPTPSDATVTINGETTTSITAAYGTAIEWSVTKDGYTGQSGTDTLSTNTTKDVSLALDGDLITGVYTAKDFFLKTGTDTDGNSVTVPVASDTNNARVFVCELEDGATYNYSYTNNGESSTYRTVIATFAPTIDNIAIAPLGSTVSGIDVSTVSCAVNVLREQAKQTEGTYSGTFTNTENAKTLIMFVGWGVDSKLLTASVRKTS